MASLKVLFCECLWCEEKGLWYRTISTAYYCWFEFWHYIYWFFWSGGASAVKGNKQTFIHAHTYIHAHTPPHTNTHSSVITFLMTKQNYISNEIENSFIELLCQKLTNNCWNFTGFLPLWVASGNENNKGISTKDCWIF